jgi:SAM-dependent methyltransferase
MPDATPFKDHFSIQAGDYRRHRPGYPPALFAYLASLAPTTNRALDVATGNGQAAIGLAGHFDSVRATEPSKAQLEKAMAHPKVSYALEPAEDIAAPDGQFDLLTAAQAAHWFELPRFYQEVRRVLKPDGVIALWTYGMFQAGPTVDTVIADFYGNVVGPYWPRERHHVEEGYARLPFPFEEIRGPDFAVHRDWSFHDALGYLRSWSAVTRYARLRGRDPLDLVAAPLASAWGEGRRRVTWPLRLRVGRREARRRSMDPVS